MTEVYLCVLVQIVVLVVVDVNIVGHIEGLVLKIEQHYLYMCLIVVDLTFFIVSFFLLFMCVTNFNINYIFIA
jgi:hypothetical protein